MLNQAYLAYQNGNISLAKSILENLIDLQSRNMQALQMLGAICAMEKNYEVAIKLFTKAIKIEPSNPQIYFNRGNAYGESGNYHAAISDLGKSLKINPRNCEALLAIGNSYRACGDDDLALASYEKAMRIDDRFYKAQLNIACILIDRRDFGGAINLLNKVIDLAPDLPEANSNMGLALQRIGKVDASINFYRRALAIKGDYFDAYYNLGNALRELGNMSESLLSYDKAISIKNDFSEAWCNRSIVLNDMGRYEEAIASCNHAIGIKPNYPEAYSNRGNSLKELKRIDEAIASYQEAINANSMYAEAYCNLGNLYKIQNNLELALINYDKAIALKSDLVDANLNKSLILLNKCDYEAGWGLYEWRLKKQTDSIILNKYFDMFSIAGKLWTGGECQDGLLIFGEQGLGDQILYASMLHEFLKMNTTVTVAVDKRIIKLLKPMHFSINFVDVDDFDLMAWTGNFLPLGSLGRIFRPTQISFANAVYPYMKADAVLVNKYRDAISKRGKITCGISWKSASKNSVEKSIELIELIDGMNGLDFEFINLQYGEHDLEIDMLRRERGVELVSLEDVDVFSDVEKLAALIEACDVIITISNSTAHISGAIGKSTHLILPVGEGRLWYWQAESKTNNWYPSVKAYEQSRVGDWSAPVSQIRDELSEKFYGKN
jgi:tetratricopeptide (TPR) repeat protein